MHRSAAKTLKNQGAAEQAMPANAVAGPAPATGVVPSAGGRRAATQGGPPTSRMVHMMVASQATSSSTVALHLKR